MARGKCGNKISILIPDDREEAIGMMEKARGKNLDKANKSLLGNPLAHVSGHFCAGTLLMSVLAEIRLQRPELILSTRHQAAKVLHDDLSST